MTLKTLHRRDFIRYLGAGLGTAWLQGCATPPKPPACPETAAGPAQAAWAAAADAPAPGPRHTQVVLFDAFAVFDPRPVFRLAGELFPGTGPALAEEWRTRQFEYTWLRTASQRYKDFWAVTEDALRFACSKLALDLTDAKRERLMGAYLALRPWPDAPGALEALRDQGLRLAFLSNMTEPMLRANARASGIERLFDEMLSTDRRATYKPHPQAYALGMEAFGVRREEAVFVAFAGWDAAGAKWFGYPTFWNNRLRMQQERLDVEVDAQGPTLDALPPFVRG